MVTREQKRFRPGTRVSVPWGRTRDRTGEVVEVWGEGAAPTHVRVRLDPLEDDEEASILLLNPSNVTPLAS